MINAEPKNPGGASEAALSQTPSGGFSSFIEAMKSKFPPEQPSQSASPDQAPAAAAGEADKASDSESSSPLDKFKEGMTSTFPPEQSDVSNSQDAAPKAAENASQTFSDAASAGMEAAQKSPDSLKAINDEAPEAQQSDAPAVSGITNFFETVKEKLQPAQDTSEAASTAAQSVSESAPDSSSLGGKAEEAAQTVNDAAAASATTANDTAAVVQSISTPSEKETLDAAPEEPKAGLFGVIDNLKEKLLPAQPEQSVQSTTESNPSEAAGEAAQSVTQSVPTQEAGSTVQSVSDQAQDSASNAVQSVRDSVPDTGEASAAGEAQSSEGNLRTVSDEAPDAEGAEAADLADKATNAISEKVPESMGGKDKLENVAPDSVPGKFESLVDNLRSKLPGQSDPSAQSTPSTEVSSSNANGTAETLIRQISDNVFDSVGPITPSKGLAEVSSGSNGVTDALTSVSNKVAGAADNALEQAESSFGPNPVEQVSAGAEAATRDARKDAANPANSGMPQSACLPSPL